MKKAIIGIMAGAVVLFVVLAFIGSAELRHEEHARTNWCRSVYATAVVLKLEWTNRTTPFGNTMRQTVLSVQEALRATSAPEKIAFAHEQLRDGTAVIADYADARDALDVVRMHNDIERAGQTFIPAMDASAVYCKGHLRG